MQVNSDQDTLFWDHIWLGDNAIREDFPRLYMISNKKDEVISNVCVGVGDEIWDLRFKKGLRVYMGESTIGRIEINRGCKARY